MICTCNFCQSTYKAKTREEEKTCKFCGVLIDGPEPVVYIKQDFRPKSAISSWKYLGVLILPFAIWAFASGNSKLFEDTLNPAEVTANTLKNKKWLSSNTRSSVASCSKNLKNEIPVNFFSKETIGLVCNCYVEQLIEETAPKIHEVKDVDIELLAALELWDNSKKYNGTYSMICTGKYGRRIQADMDRGIRKSLGRSRNMPHLTLDNADQLSEKELQTYRSALDLLYRWGNSPEFMGYVQNKRKYFSHTSMSVKNVLRVLSHQFEQSEEIPVWFFDEGPEPDVVGVWDGYMIREYRNFKRFVPERRAAHLLHEISHVMEWDHKGNDPLKHDNLNSVPYALARDFEDFLTYLKYPTLNMIVPEFDLSGLTKKRRPRS